MAPPVKNEDINFQKSKLLNNIKLNIEVVDKRHNKRFSQKLVYKVKETLMKQLDHLNGTLDKDSKLILKVEILYYTIGLSGTFCTAMHGYNITVMLPNGEKKNKRIEQYARSVPCFTSNAQLSASRKTMNEFLENLVKWFKEERIFPQTP